jgi:predicted DCC family thiol-disulfide oxidoreductase YuxK
MQSELLLALFSPYPSSAGPREKLASIAREAPAGKGAYRPMVREPAPLQGAPVVLYDGVCGLCNRLNRFILKRDRRNLFRFAPLQGRFARQVLERHGKDPRDLDTLYLVLDPGRPSERILWKARAVLEILRNLGGVWKLSAVLRVLPARLLDRLYDLVAKYRYRIFGKLESCPIPAPGEREKFIED